jgi:hypothetical protein
MITLSFLCRDIMLGTVPMVGITTTDAQGSSHTTFFSTLPDLRQLAAALQQAITVITKEESRVIRLTCPSREITFGTEPIADHYMVGITTRDANATPLSHTTFSFTLDELRQLAAGIQQAVTSMLGEPYGP